MRTYSIIVSVGNMAAGKDFHTWSIDTNNINDVNTESGRLFEQLKPIIDEAFSHGNMCNVHITNDNKDVSFNFYRNATNDVTIRAFSTLAIVSL